MLLGGTLMKISTFRSFLGYPHQVRSNGILASICSNIFYITNIIIIYHHGLIFRSKRQKKWNSHQILHISLWLGFKFQFQQFYFLEKIFQRRILPVENRKNEHHRWIFPIRITISICAKFAFLDQICPKRVFLV